MTATLTITVASSRTARTPRFTNPRIAPVGARFRQWTAAELLEMAAAPVSTTWETVTYPIGARFPRRSAIELAERTPTSSRVLVPVRMVGARYHGAPFTR